MTKSKASEPEAVETQEPLDTTPGEPIGNDPDPGPFVFDPNKHRSPMDDPAHPLHHLRNA